MLSTELIKYSLKNLWTRKGRSLLTIFSIFVGIATVFIFISFGLGLYAYIQDFTTGSSVDKVLIYSKTTGMPGLDDTFKLDEGDLEAVEDTSGVFKASGSYFRVAQVKQKKEGVYTFITGYDPDNPIMMDSFDVGIEKGRWLKSSDDGKAILGYNYMIPDKIFSRAYDVGDKIEIQGVDVEVTGFLEEIGSPTDDSQIYVTNDYLLDLYPDEDLSYGMLIAQVDVNDIDSVVDKIEKNLRKHRGLEEGKEDFYAQSFKDLIETFSVVLNGVVGFIILIALISVLVSAINTANTMITSVLERTKEIGVMKAIGATNSEVFNIFLFESLFLGSVAGILGVLFGWLLAYIGGVILDNLGWGFLSPSFPLYLFLGCIAFAALTGAISGALPSYQASKLKPVDTLRYE
ncbi:MAG: ABC transporter permease [Nanoarchaeota archaeon]|nr:ABC transporter permease [Nanoarchaeota archaeon]